MKEPMRKRKSKIVDREEEEQKLEKEKNQAKERAQKSRNRKKRYTEELEEKVKILEKQVKYLTLELDKYKKFELKKEVDCHKHNRSVQEETTILEGILNHLQTSTSVGGLLKTHANLSTTDGAKGECRQKTLDKAFQVIVDFMLPDTFSMAFFFLQQKKPGVDYIDVEKIRKMHKSSKFQIQEMYDNKEVDDGDIHWHSTGITVEQAIAINRKSDVMFNGKERSKTYSTK